MTTEHATDNDTRPEPVMGGARTNGIETGLFGRWTVRFRNLCGVIAVCTTCLNSLWYVWTIHTSVSRGFGWPDRMSLFIITCGPIIVAFSYIDASKVLRILTQTDGVGDRMRKKVIATLSRPGDARDDTERKDP